LDFGIDMRDWGGREDRPVLLGVDDDGRLVPAAALTDGTPR
jgi:hypothetical protein